MSLRHLTEVGPVEWLRIARTYDGVAEVVGGKLNPRIAKMFGATHFPTDKLTKKTAWCAAFVSHCLAYAGVPSPRTANAAACANYGVAVAREDVREGDIIVLAPGVVGAGTSGHVGFYERAVKDVPEEFVLYSGNCQNTAKSHRYPWSRVVAIRRPNFA